MNFFIQIINTVLSSVGAVATTLISLLPDSPFTWVVGSNGATVWINWLFPISGYITTISAYVVCVAAYYIIRVALRWVKVVGS